MKRFEFAVDAYQAEWMLGAIRSKCDIISLLMRTIKIMLLPPLPNPGAVGNVILKIDNMSRLIYVFEGKIFSINFPYFATFNDGALTFTSAHRGEIDSAVTSNVLAVIEMGDALSNREILRFAEPISAICEYDDNFWCTFRDLLMYEDGYVRYDHDDRRANCHLHPLDHLDIFYSTGSTFKLGMHTPPSHEHFLDVLDVKTDCYYLATIR